MTTTDLTTTQPADLTTIGQLANGYAAQGVFQRYQTRKADNTLRSQRAALALFGAYLQAAGVAVGDDDLASEPDMWRGVTWGLVDGFVLWMIQEGYAMGTVNGRLSAVKSYAKLAAKAGALPASEMAMIRTVEGYSRTEGKRIDDRRAVTRKGAKKTAAVSVTPAQVRQLKKQPGTPQGRRDAVIIALLADHGLRVGELAGLEVTAVNLEAGTLTFYRPKVDKVQTHSLTRDARRALRAYIEAGDIPAIGPLLRASVSAARLTAAGMTARGIADRVRTLGAALGIDGLSPHDLRHYWATQAARNGTPIDRLQDAGGWTSPAMPLRYVEAARIANEGVRLEEE